MSSRKNKRPGFSANRGSINKTVVVYSSTTVSQFPSNPVDGQVIIDGEFTYIYDADTDTWSNAGSSGTKSNIVGVAEINVTTNNNSIFGTSAITISLDTANIQAGTNIEKSGSGLIVGSSDVTISTAQSVSFTTAIITSLTVDTATITTANIDELIINTASIVTLSISNDFKYTNQVDVATETSSGVTGQVVFGTSSIFVCVDTDIWKKIDYGSW